MFRDYGGEAVHRFDEASRRAALNYTDLIATRNLQILPDGGAISLEQLKLVISGFFPRNTRVLLYDYHPDEGCLRSWIVGGEGIVAFHTRRVALKELEIILAEFRASLGVDDPSWRREAMRRVAPVIGHLTATRRGTDEVQRAVEELLLPSAISEGVQGAEHIVVVPVLDFAAVPFAMLRQSSGRPLIDDVALTIAPGLPTLGAVLDPLPARPLNALVVGNPHMQTDPQWNFRSLPYAEREALEVAQVLDSEPLIGSDATTERIDGIASAAGRIHIAAHGVADAVRPLEDSFIALANGRWAAGRIQTGSFASDLAVLSACQTGLGRAHAAGIIGLARAFHLAGVPRIATTLWSVRDEPTAQMMVDFERMSLQVDPAGDARIHACSAR